MVFLDCIQRKFTTRETSEKEVYMYRHGDVIIKKINGIQGEKLNHLILAEGEVTGHKHEITEGDAELYQNGDVLYLRVHSKNAKLTHPEHAPITLPKNDYEISIQKEYEPNGWRKVSH